MDPLRVSQLYSNLAIPPASRCIRLLEIEAAVDGLDGLDTLGPLTGHLRLVNLDDNPSFVSLSYVWGKGASSHYIVCEPGNCLVNIPRNCFRGLQQVTRRFGKVAIWVDSICINQNDDEEKVHQIPLMRDIYSMANCVYVWLGDGNKASDRALKFLKKQARLGPRPPLAIVRAQSDDEYRDALRQYQHASWRDMIYRLSLWRLWTRKVDLDVILRSPWVFRCWTFQEFLLARDMVFLCGEETIIWEELANAIYFRHRESLSLKPVKLKSSINELFTINEPSAINGVPTEEWWPLVTLWFNFPRSGLRSWPRQGRDQQRVKSIQEGVGSVWSASRYGPASQVHVFCIGSSVLVGVALVALYCALWKGVKAVIDDSGLFGVVCFFGSLVYLPTSIDLLKNWIRLVIGLKDPWAKANFADGEIRARVIDGVRSALKNRDCSDLHDKTFSLYGILDICRITPSKPDYGRSLGETYHTLMHELIAWDPQALVMILDAGKPLQLSPSWIPNWSESGPSEWLVSQYLMSTGACPNAAHPSLPRDVIILDKTILRLQGHRIGPVTFSTDMVIPAEGRNPQVQPRLGRDLLVSALFRLVQFFACVGRGTSDGLLRDDTTTTAFAVLEGLIRIRGGTHKRASGGMAAVHDVRLPAWEGPYDFTKEKKEFWRLAELLKVIAAALPNFNLESEEASRHATVQLFEQLASWAYIGKYFLRLVEILVEQKRGLYVLSGGLAGTGPLGVSVGDEVFVIPGIPTPMVLRKADNGRGWTVVGATLVHSIMYGESFVEGKYGTGYETIDLY
ncbi:unnamed protein product [Clonostachys byssicola]|uniref:Heterokaryon incompatibility domain-containing protein n=1 Tax=Clonostachys byssicola TaxID=160290 RepID=A0A9N9UCS2_9HYPO|nr:unnamed protein product [Clonostachys byssicola]